MLKTSFVRWVSELSHTRLFLFVSSIRTKFSWYFRQLDSFRIKQKNENRSTICDIYFAVLYFSVFKYDANRMNGRK